VSAMERHRCTHAIIAPTVAAALVNSPLVESHDLSSLRLVRSAAASLNEPTAVELARRIGCRVTQAYGLTELSPGSHVVPDDGGIGTVGIAAPVASCGWTVPNSSSMIIDVETGREVEMPTQGLSEAGELCFKGPNVMAGYLGNPAATEGIIDSEGFLHTGDLARVDAQGCIYIVDRIKELIKYKGHQVAPTELESLLLTHRGVADAAVVGAEDEMTGEEVPKAFVVKRADARLTAEGLIDFVAARVAPHKKIRRVEFIDAVPRSANGKILRRHLSRPGDTEVIECSRDDRRSTAPTRPNSPTSTAGCSGCAGSSRAPTGASSRSPTAPTRWP
jgi:acyl-CoA synthetase (AMP-forming)/AMP-acid ligase II